MQLPQIKPRERDTIVQALKAGVVPKSGLRHIQVGRAQEIEQLVHDIDRIGDGGSSIRFVIGEYGSGKTFFLNLVRMIAIEKNMVVLSADLAPDRRIHATAGQARSLYAELTRNASTRSKPNGGAMASIVERFVTQAMRSAENNGNSPQSVIREKLEHLEELTGGYDFATAVSRYWEGDDTGDDDLKSASIQWLRGEFSTRNEARKSLGVRTIVNDANVYDTLKLLALFVRESGYKGLVIALDELVNLYKLSSVKARNSNYEQILRILNDVLQGHARNIGFILGGTPEFLMDTRRGLYSYEALQTRLAENTFATDGIVDFSGPVIRLANLTPENLYVLLTRIRGVMSNSATNIPDEALTAFMEHCSKRIGEAYFRTPRNTVKAFVDLLSVLDQNPALKWQSLIETVSVTNDDGDDLSDISDDETNDELASFRL